MNGSVRDSPWERVPEDAAHRDKEGSVYLQGRASG